MRGWQLRAVSGSWTEPLRIRLPPYQKMIQMFKAEKAAIDNMEDLSYNNLILHKDPHLQKSRRALAPAVRIQVQVQIPQRYHVGCTNLHVTNSLYRCIECALDTF